MALKRFRNNVYKLITIRKIFRKKNRVYICKDKFNKNNLHQSIVNYYTENIPITRRRKPRIILMMGGPGSGKNYLLETNFKQLNWIGGDIKNQVIINHDDYTALIPDYWKQLINEGRGVDIIKRFKPRVRRISNTVSLVAIRNKQNIIWNGTGKDYNKMKKKINFFKENNYDIHLVFIDVKMKDALKRVHEREMKYGRHVPEELVIDALKKILPNFLKLLKDVSHAYCFTSSITPTKLVWFKYNNRSMVLDLNEWNNILIKNNKL